MDNVAYGICYSEQSYIIRPEHLNSQGRLFGGQLMMWIDEIAGIAARRYCKCEITTACVDGLDFIEGAHYNDTLVLTAGVTFVGNTSLEVTVYTYSEKLDGSRKLINIAHITEVALDKDEKPTKVQPFVPTTPEAIEAFEQGRMRRLLRINRKKAGL